MKFRAWHPLAVGLTAALVSAAFFAPPPSPQRAEPAHPSVAAPAELLGLWQFTRPEREGDPLRFYYFHDGGIGLVRYGRMGLTYTRSFHWSAEPGSLTLVFTKDGSHHQVPYALDGEGAVLHLPKDPAFSGDNRYTKDLRPRSLEFAAEHPLARLWIEPTKDRRGGEGFRMYQLQAPTIDGRGVGWYHEGDMSEWSTETLTYRRTGGSLELFFPVRGERIATEVVMGEDGEGRTLRLAEDPRNFWHERTYRDGGPGFTVALDGDPLPYHVPGHGPAAPLGSGARMGRRGCSAH